MRKVAVMKVMAKAPSQTSTPAKTFVPTPNFQMLRGWEAYHPMLVMSREKTTSSESTRRARTVQALMMYAGILMMERM